MNWPKMSPEEQRRRMVEARLHLDFCARLYEIQHESGRLFVHEHPDRATSWGEPSMIKLKEMKNVLLVTADQCAYGLTVKVKGKERIVRKTTKFLTNSPEIAKELSRRCPQNHEHMQLKGGNYCRQAQRYPPELCEAICRGAAREQAYRRSAYFMIGSVELVADNLGSVHGVGRGGAA